ncbi:MAG: hypothetical protein PUA90_01385 [bacterium]|nr:hypothetical protein [bacterium]
MNLSSILKSINISNIAKSTSNTLNVVKKIIPVYKEIKPFITKEKSIFNKDEQKKESNITTSNDNEYNDSLTFFN